MPLLQPRGQTDLPALYIASAKLFLAFGDHLVSVLGFPHLEQKSEHRIYSHLRQMQKHHQ
ncbi:hypothetical protein C8R44DRAFT_799990 [Mycena epipterygia]|nr:hypothetical protein C8R44DRAFT_799990 [Mycena epipterygia]